MPNNLLTHVYGLLARRVLATAAVTLLATGAASATTYTWDPLHTGEGSDSSGTWSNFASNWTNGIGGNAAWPFTNTDLASFGAGGTGGLVTVSGGVSAGSLTFEAAGYTLSGGAILLNGASPTITTLADATITSTMVGLGGGSLIKSGGGTLTLNGNTAGFSTINVTSGVLKTGLTGGSSFGNVSSAIVVSSGAAIRLASGVTAGNAITFNGGPDASAFIGGATLSGAITLNSGDTKINASNVAEISGTIGGIGSMTLNGPNKLTLSGTNTFSGGITLLDGILEAASTGALGTGVLNNGTTLQLNASLGETMTFANAITGVGSISKSGKGTAVLTGDVSSTGYTIISGGTLAIDGNKLGATGAAGSLLYVGGTGAVLSGTGTIVGATAGAITILSGGAVAPGRLGTIGTLTATSLSWTSDNTSAGMFFDLSSTSSSADMLALTGAFSRASTTGSYLFDFGNTGALGRTYTLMTFASTSSTSVANLVATNLPSGWAGVFSMTGSSLQMSVVAVPEPAEVGFMIGAFGLVLILMRRRRHIADAFEGVMKKPMIKNTLQVLLAIATVAMGVQPAGAKTVTIDLETATFDDLQAAMNAHALTSVELAMLYLNRRAVYDQAGIKINSVVSINPNLMDDAAAADALRATSGQVSPIHGLVFCTKDSYPTINMVTSGGVKSWLSSVTGTFGTETGITYGPVISPVDCFVVGKLKAAGAVQLGHGNMDTWATSAGSTTSNAYGTTLNAYCLGSASGSSGGPGALTGSNFANFAWGGETGGSIRNPSDRAGVTGFKVTVGTNSVNNIIPLASDRDVVGPMARYVKDEAYIMDVAATQIDPTDLWSTINYVPGRGLSRNYATKVNSASLAGKKIGIVGIYLGQARPTPAPTPVQLTDADVAKALGGSGHGGILNFTTNSSSNTTGVNTPDTTTQAVFDRAVAELRAQGATVVTVFLPPNLDTAVTIPTTFTDGATTPTAALNGNNPAVTSISGITTTVATYATTTLALENRGFQLLHGQGIYTRLTQANAASGSLSTATRGLAYDNNVSDFKVPAAVTHFQLKAIYNAIYEKFMDQNGLDCLIWPTSFTKSRASNSVSGRDLVNNMGLPVCTVPIGVYAPLGGEPITLAMLGRYRKESDVLALAGAYQKAYNHRIPSPLSPPLDGETITYETSGAIYQSLKAGGAAGKNADTLPPVVSIKGKATIKGTKAIIHGIVDDASGVGSIKVYVNGRKVVSKVGKKWTASVPLSDLKKWTKSKASKIEVSVLAKDGAGNASATVKLVKIES